MLQYTPKLPRKLQEILDLCAMHLMAQARPAVALRASDPPRYRPRYHSDDGAKCPVGLFIPADRYSPELDWLPLCEVVVKCGLMTAEEVARSDVKGRNRWALLNRLREVHDVLMDMVGGPEQFRCLWAAHFLSVAGDFRLRVPLAVENYYHRTATYYARAHAARTNDQPHTR